MSSVIFKKINDFREIRFEYHAVSDSSIFVFYKFIPRTEVAAVKSIIIWATVEAFEIKVRFNGTDLHRLVHYIRIYVVIQLELM